jgi:hypothetical protein
VNERKRATYLAKSGGLGVGPGVGERILVVVVSIAISSDDDNTENFRQQHLGSSVVNF